VSQTWECDVCGNNPCERPSFCRTCRRIDKANPPGREAREPERTVPAVAESTRMATAWLKKFCPDRLDDWLARHPERPPQANEEDFAP
jgi:hypothetical protein